jgi:hypothetical protein
MRLPFPERIPLPVAMLAATVLVGLQQLQGTNLNFSLYTFLFTVIATIAFNAAGGFTRPSGSYIFFYAVLGVLLGVVYKAYLGEPGDSVLRTPVKTMQVFTGGITAMLVAALVSRKLTRRNPYLGKILKEKDLRNAAIGCFAFGLFLSVTNAVLPHQNGSILSAVTQLDHFLPMSIIIATFYTVKRSQGTRGFSTLVLVTMGGTFAFGLVAFGKEAMFTPILCWLVAASSLRLKIRPYQIVLGGLVLYVMFHFLVPYSQYGRDQVPLDATFADRAAIAFTLVTDLDGVRTQYLDSRVDAELDSLAYYSEPQGFFDRLTMIGPDDALINITDKNGPAGLLVIPADFANWIPHFLWPNKPPSGNGNQLAHKIGGIVGDEDFTTGISFTPSGEAYHLAGWTGVFVVAPLIWILLFTVFDSLCGDVRESPWGLLMIAVFSHIAPEGMLDGAIYIIWFGSVGILFIAILTSYVMPLLGTLIAGAEQTGLIRLRRTLAPPIPHRLSLALAPPPVRISRWHRQP